MKLQAILNLIWVCMGLKPIVNGIELKAEVDSMMVDLWTKVFLNLDHKQADLNQVLPNTKTDLFLELDKHQTKPTIHSWAKGLKQHKRLFKQMLIVDRTTPKCKVLKAQECQNSITLKVGGT